MRNDARENAAVSAVSRNRWQSPLGQLVLYMLMALIAIMPLPWGSIYQWSWLPIGLAILFLTAIAVALRLRAGEVDILTRPAVLAVMALYGLVVAWVFVQAGMPSLETGSVGHTVPRPQYLPDVASLTISISPEDTTLGGVRLMIFGSMFVLAALFATSRINAKRLTWFIMISGAVYAVVGIMQGLAGLEILPTGRRNPMAITGTFFNRNMFAAHIGMAFLCAVGVGADLLSRQLPRSGRLRIAVVEAMSAKAASIWLVIICGSALFSALVLTASRGGILSVIVALVVLFALIRRSQMPISRALRNRRTVWVLTGLLLLFGAVVFVLAGQYLAARTGGLAHAGDVPRLTLYATVISILQERPMTGFGYGTFPKIYFLYSDRFLDAGLTGIYEYAHNLYLDLAIELGIVAAVMVLGAIVILMKVCVRGVSVRRRDQIYPALSAAVLAQIGVHGLVDLPLFLPAVAATFSLVLGVGVAQSWSTRRDVADNA